MHSGIHKEGEGGLLVMDWSQFLIQITDFCNGALLLHVKLVIVLAGPTQRSRNGGSTSSIMTKYACSPNSTQHTKKSANSSAPLTKCSCLRLG